jgi:hypothetical protein
MADHETIRRAVERAVADVFTTVIPGLQNQVIERVLRDVQPIPLASPAPDALVRLKACLDSIHEATTQSAILQVLLEGVAAFGSRAALFLVRGDAAVGWHARGFRENDPIRLLTVDIRAGLAARALAQRSCVEGPAVEFESRLGSSLGLPVQGNCLLVPLAVRGRIIALVYADAGQQSSGGLERPVLEILVQAAVAWIELMALRKLLPTNLAAETTGSDTKPKPAAVGVPAAELGVAPPTTTVCPERAEGPAVLSPGSGQAVPADSPAAARGALQSATTASPVEGGANASPSPETEELHRKARRFAKLLVDEIKLYHGEKVVQGKQNRDLYVRLRDDIDKSRASYERRYGQGPIADSDYFTAELIQNLADNNPNLLGSGFSR